MEVVSRGILLGCDGCDGFVRLCGVELSWTGLGWVGFLMVLLVMIWFRL